MNRNLLRLILLSTLLVSSSMMCSIFGPKNLQITEPERKATIDSLQLTVSVLEKQVVIPTIEPTTQITFPTLVKPPTGSIIGTFTYPADDNPRLRIVAINVNTGEFIATEELDHNNYKLDELPVGKYHVLAYPVDMTSKDKNLIGGFSQFVICGQTANCTDHALVDVEVTNDMEIKNINPTDWYAPEGSFPIDPTK